MSLATYYLEYGRYVAGIRRRRRRHARAPTSNADNHEKNNSWVSFSFLYEYGAPLGGPSGAIDLSDHERHANVAITGFIRSQLFIQQNARCKHNINFFRK